MAPTEDEDTIAEARTYRGPDGEIMADWGDLYRLMDDTIYVRAGGNWDKADDHHALAWLLAALLTRDLDSARQAIEIYERQVPGFSYDRGERWEWLTGSTKE